MRDRSSTLWTASLRHCSAASSLHPHRKLSSWPNPNPSRRHREDGALESPWESLGLIVLQVPPRIRRATTAAIRFELGVVEFNLAVGHRNGFSRIIARPDAVDHVRIDEHISQFDRKVGARGVSRLSDRYQTTLKVCSLSAGKKELWARQTPTVPTVGQPASPVRLLRPSGASNCGDVFSTCQDENGQKFSNF